MSRRPAAPNPPAPATVGAPARQPHDMYSIRAPEAFGLPAHAYHQPQPALDFLLPPPAPNAALSYQQHMALACGGAAEAPFGLPAYPHLAAPHGGLPAYPHLAAPHGGPAAALHAAYGPELHAELTHAQMLASMHAPAPESKPPRARAARAAKPARHGKQVNVETEIRRCIDRRRTEGAYS